MTKAQVVVVILTVLMNAMDGFDVLSIAFASPGIAREWGIAQTALGVVLSMELIGMAFGSVLLGGVADKIGRRPTILACLAVMVVGMLAAHGATASVTIGVYVPILSGPVVPGVVETQVPPPWLTYVVEFGGLASGLHTSAPTTAVHSAVRTSMMPPGAGG